MPEMFELDPADELGAGAVGEPGERAFYLQARKESAQLTVLVEKEQVALLATEATAFLDQIDTDYPDAGPDPAALTAAELHEPAVPLFRARAIGIGFDPERRMVLLELREHGQDDEPSESDDPGDGEAPEEGWVARIYATRAQVRAMLSRGAAAVTAGRPLCSLCDQPMDPDGHRCPRWN